MKYDLRRVDPHPFTNDRDGERREAFSAAVELAETSQPYRYCVAPTCGLMLTDGRVLRGGHALVAADLVGGVGHDPRRHESPREALRRHLFETRVLERPGMPELSARDPEAGPVEYSAIGDIPRSEAITAGAASEETRDRFREAFRGGVYAARTRFVVAPLRAVRLPDGRLLRPGDSLAVLDLVEAHDDEGRALTAIDAMRRLVRDAIVIHSPARPEVPAAPALAAVPPSSE